MSSSSIRERESPCAELFELAEDSQEQLDAYIDDGELLVATVNDEIVAHLQLIFPASTGDPEIKNMAVRPDFQGRGIGRALVAEALTAARSRGGTRVVVATATADIGNLRFYQRLGFRLTRIESMRSFPLPATRR